MSPSTGCASASTAGGWTSPRRSTGDFWEEFRDALPGGRPRRLPGGGDLEPQAGVAHRPALRRAHELPARGGDHRVRRGLAPRLAGRVGARRVPRSMSCPATGPRSRPSWSGCWRSYDPDVTAVMLNLLGSHDTPRAAHGLRRRHRGRAPRDAAPDDPAGRAVQSTTATRSAWRATRTPTAGAPSRPSDRPGTRGCARM